MKTADKEKVRNRHPDATARCGRDGLWIVSDISLQTQHRLNKDSTLKRTRVLLGMGSNETEAWRDAVKNIETQEGKKLV